MLKALCGLRQLLLETHILKIVSVLRQLMRNASYCCSYDLADFILYGVIFVCS